MANVLVIRTSSFGDVALLVPVIYSVASRYPQTRFVVMTRQAYTPLFSQLAFNISVTPLDVRKKHKGVLGLFRFTGKILGGRYSHVADVHDVLRTKIARFFLHLTFTKVRKIDKGRKEKDLMVSTKTTNVSLTHATERYFDVFERLGFPAPMIYQNFYSFNQRNFSLLSAVITEKKGTWIGIAPFAQHQGKVYPLDKMEKVVEQLSQREDTTLFLFGAGTEEMRTINKWRNKYPNIVNHHGHLKLQREILLISYLDVMVSMDSANMHLASLVEVPVVSVWGATHPALGFYGFNQDSENAVQRKLNCRPCSVYGASPCQFQGKDEYKCMKGIEESDILNKIENVLEKALESKAV